MEEKIAQLEKERDQVAVDEQAKADALRKEAADLKADAQKKEEQANEVVRAARERISFLNGKIEALKGL